MKLYQLLWTLIKHGLHGRFRDEVFVSVELETETRSIGIVGPVTSFEWTGDADAFCTINGTSEDDEPWSEDPPFIDRLIEASSLGMPEAKVLRESAPDEQVDRIMARVRQLDAQDRRRPL